MNNLVECIKDKSLNNTKEIQEAITSMVCNDSDLVQLPKEKLTHALSIEGEFLVLKLHYNDFADELRCEAIKYKISQALSVIVTYEEDGYSYNNIEQFVNYIHSNSDDKQNSIFGVKKVDRLSEFPITILFSGILPINQLKMSVGKKIDALIHSDDSYFVPRFTKHRDDLSKELGIPILPVLPILDESLHEREVRLLDIQDNRIIASFSVEEFLNKETVEIYLLKLFYIYKVLAEEKKFQ